MTRLRSIGCVLLLAVASIGMVMVVLETTLRLFSPQALLHDPDAFVPDPILGARLKPGFQDHVVTTEFASTWKVNADGHRGPRAGEGGPASRRIVAVGDSFTFGYGVEEEQAWPRQVELRLNETRAPADRIEVLNLGVGGYGTWQEALWLEEKAGTLHPDLALVGFYVGNDPSDNARTVPASASGRSGGAHDIPAPGPAGPPRGEALKRWLGSRLHLYALVSSRADELLVRFGLRRLVYPFEMEILLPEEPPAVTAAWRSTRTAFARLAEISRGTGVPVIVVLIPMKHQVSDQVWDRLRTYYGELAGTDKYDRDRPQRLLAEMIAAEGLEEIDLLEGLREAARKSGDGSALYWPRDQHWTVPGHAEAARLIASAVAGRTASP